MPRFSNEPLTSESSTAETRTGKARLAKARAIGNFFIEVRVIFRGEAYGKHSSYHSCPPNPPGLILRDGLQRNAVRLAAVQNRSAKRHFSLRARFRKVRLRRSIRTTVGRTSFLETSLAKQRPR